MPQKDLVDVKLENLVLGQRLLQAKREQRLLYLAFVGLLAGEKIVAGDLHGDRAGTLSVLARAQVGERRAGHAGDVDTRMTIEGVVLGRQYRVDEQRRHVLDLHRDATLVAEFPDERTVRGVDPQRDLETDVPDRFDGGQIGQQAPHKHADGGGCEQARGCRYGDEPEHDTGDQPHGRGRENGGAGVDLG